MKVSILVPCFNEGEAIVKTKEAIVHVMETMVDRQRYDYQIVFVNDGSKDSTLTQLKQMAVSDKHVFYISFSRNFGKESAMLAGLRFADGDCVIIMDADLQHPPEIIPQMLEKYEEGFDQVIARRNRSGDSKFKTLTARMYYRLVNRLVDVKLTDGIGDFRLLSGRAVQALLSLEEYNRFSKGLFSWIGFKETCIEYENQSRIAGETKWSFGKLLQYGIDGILSFNNKPLRFCITLGAVLIVLSIIYIIYVFVGIMIGGITAPGYFTLISAVLIIGGVQLISVGIIGEYIGRIYYEVKKRPHYIVEETNITKGKKD